MSWYETLGVAIATGGAALAGAQLNARHQRNLAKDQRQEDRRDRGAERRNEAYRQYFRWLAQVPLSNENKASSLARAQEARVAVADLLLYASPSVKAKAKEVESALGEANNRLIVELAKMSKEAKAGQWEHSSERVQPLSQPMGARHFLREGVAGSPRTGQHDGR